MYMYKVASRDEEVMIKEKMATAKARVLGDFPPRAPNRNFSVSLSLSSVRQL